jgi:hypothetical protein
MKILYKIILVSAFVSIVSNLQAQYQSIFGTNQTSWKYAYFGCLGCSNIDSATVVYGMDTVIQGMNFKRVSKIGSSPFPHDFYLSEDNMNGRVYYYNLNYLGNQIVKIVDLSMQVGDTLKTIGFVVDSVYVQNGRKHLRTNFASNSLAFSMIEGVGTTFGIDCAAMGTGEGLLCQLKNNVINYTGITHPTYDCQTNMVLTAIGENDLLNQMTLLPNPASIYIGLNLNGMGAKEIELLDVKGHLIKTFMNAENRLDISEIESGIYFLKVYLNKGFVSKKLMVAK